MEWSCELHIIPLPKGRPRFGKNGVYTDSRTQGCEEEIKWIVSQRWKRPPCEGPVEVSMVFHLPNKRRVDATNLASVVLVLRLVRRLALAFHFFCPFCRSRRLSRRSLSTVYVPTMQH